MTPLSFAENVPLAPLTTLEVGGAARYLARCADVDQLVMALVTAREHQLETIVLGGGSNVVIADDGFDGLVLTLGIEDLVLETDQRAGTALVRAGAGVVWDALVAQTTSKGLGGLECLSGIPGLVGAAPIQNIGAYGQDVAQTVHAVHAVQRSTGALQTFSAEACRFGYRASRFKGADRGRWIVVAVDFRLPITDRGTIVYGDLERRFADANPPPTPAAVRAAVLEIRAAKSMVIRADDPNRRSVGSFFVNPTVSQAVATDVATRAGDRRRSMPAFPAADGAVKLSAGWLIEAAGFRRGHRSGRVGLSSRHALAIVNHGGATAAAVLALAEAIQRSVVDRFGIAMEREPTLVGFRCDDSSADVDTLLGP